MWKQMHNTLKKKFRTTVRSRTFSNSGKKLITFYRCRYIGKLVQHDHCLHNERNGNIKPWEHKGKSKTASSLNLARNRYHWVTSLGMVSTIFKKNWKQITLWDSWQKLTEIRFWGIRLDQRFTRDKAYLSRFSINNTELTFVQFWVDPIQKMAWKQKANY